MADGQNRPSNGQKVAAAKDEPQDRRQPAALRFQRIGESVAGVGGDRIAHYVGQHDGADDAGPGRQLGCVHYFRVSLRERDGGARLNLVVRELELGVFRSGWDRVFQEIVHGPSLAESHHARNPDAPGPREKGNSLTRGMTT